LIALRYQDCVMTQANERTATLSYLVGKQIKLQLFLKEMSGRDLAGQLGVSPSWVSYRLSGKQEIGLNDMFAIANALGLKVDDILTPEVVAQAAEGSRTTHGYQTVTGQEPSRPGSIGQVGARPRDNRPAGHPSTDGGPRTSRLPRGRRRPGK
jgi:transcriptional regulator with XRE-family HTH domain